MHCTQLTPVHSHDDKFIAFCQLSVLPSYEGELKKSTWFTLLSHLLNCCKILWQLGTETDDVKTLFQLAF